MMVPIPLFICSESFVSDAILLVTGVFADQVKIAAWLS